MKDERAAHKRSSRNTKPTLGCGGKEVSVYRGLLLSMGKALDCGLAEIFCFVCGDRVAWIQVADALGACAGA